MKLFLKPDLFKGIATPIGMTKPSVGPRGGKIKKISPTTGKPIYYKPWESTDGYQMQGGSSEDSPYAIPYQQGGIIGKTRKGHPIPAHVTEENTKVYNYDDHKDAHKAHFALAQYIRNLIQKKKVGGHDTNKLQGLYEAHMNFSRHHNEQALLDLLHGKAKKKSEEDLSEKQLEKKRLKKDRGKSKT